MRRLFHAPLCALLFAGLTGAAGAIEVTLDDPELKACMERVVPEKSMTQEVTIKLTQGGEVVNTSTAELFWKRGENGMSRAIMRMTGPPERAGIAVLAIEKNKGEPELHVYLPEQRKARRVAGRTIDASMFGTDFSYEDFAHFQGMAEQNSVKRLEDQTIDGARQIVLEALPVGEGSKYSKILSFIHADHCVLSKIEFYAKNGTLLKDLAVTPEQVKEIGTRFIPHQVVLHDHKRNSTTELSIDKLEIDPELSDTMFSPTRFGASR